LRNDAVELLCSVLELRPESSAMCAADFPVTLPDNEPLGHMVLCRRALSWAFSSTAPWRFIAAMKPSNTASGTITLFSDEQLVALSNVVERVIFAAAASRPPDESMMEATLPAATPTAGVT